MISANASTREIARSFGSITPEKIIRGNYKSLASIKREIGQEKTEKAIAILIGDAAMAFGEKMDYELALDLAAEIQTEFYYMTLEDCYVVLSKLKRQPLYGKLTLNKILTAFEQYQEERINVAEKMNFNAHLAVKENPNANDRDISPLKSDITLKNRRK